MKLWVTLIGCSLAFALAAWAIRWASAGSSGPADGVRVGPVSDDVAASATPGVAADERAASARIRSSVAEVGGGGGVRSKRVRLVAVLPGELPAPGAEVLFWPVRPRTQRESDHMRRTEANDLEVALRATGRMVTTDERGIAEIEVEDGSELCVRSGEFYAESNLAWDDGSLHLLHRIELRRDVTLGVQVVDQEGRPSPRVAVRADFQAASRRSGTEEGTENVGTTDEHGFARLPHAQQVMTMPETDIVDWSLRVWCGTNQLTAAESPVSRQDLLAGNPIRLVVPVGGTIAVEVTDADGKPCGGWGGVFLDDPLSDAIYRPDIKDLARGLFHFRQVPLGRKWSLRVRRNDETCRVSLAGPARVEDTVQARVQFQQRLWDIRGRVRRADAVALDGAEVSFYASALGEASPRLLCREQGEFRLRAWLAAATKGIDDLRLKVSHQLLPDPFATTIERQLLPGSIDLGDLVVPVSTSETLLATVEVRAEGLTTTNTWVDLRAADGKALQPVPVLTYRNGSVFTIRGVPPKRPIFVVCGHPDCVPISPLPVATGEHVVVDLKRGAKLWLSIVPPSVPRDLLLAEVNPLDAPEPEFHTASLAGNDRFLFRRLRPGRYGLRVFAQQRLIYKVPVIDLKRGVNVWPIDEARLDLRAHARAIFVGARPLDGNGAAPALGIAIPAGALALPNNLDECLAVENWFVLRDKPMDLLFCAFGFVPVRLSNPTADTPVLMRRCTTLHVCVPQGERVTVVLRVVDDGVRDPALRQFDETNAHGIVEFHSVSETLKVPYASSTVIDLTVTRNGVEAPPQRIVVGDTSPQEVVLR